MKNLLFFFIALVTSALVAGSLTSCSDDDCSIAGRAMINGSFYTTAASGYTERDTLPTLTVTALGTDSIIINRETNVQAVSLPLSYVSDMTVLVFHYDYATDPAIADTIYISQKNTLFFESIECGYSMEQEITDITHTEHQLSSITINNKNANINGTENLTFLFKASN